MTSCSPKMPATHRWLGVAGLIVAVMLALPAESAAAPIEETGFVRANFRDDDGEHGYVVYVPPGYTADREWPVMLFLHGAGERGTDGVRPSEIGLGAMIRRWGEFPWIVVFPQAEDSRGPIRSVWSPDASDGRRAMAILDEVERRYRVDPRHRVLTGWSMGGRGCYMLAAAFPEKWSAVVPIAGWADLELAPRLTDVPLWSFHGTADTLVSYADDQSLVTAIREAGGEPYFTTMPDRGHYIWRSVYASPAVFEWMSDPARFAGRNEPPEIDPIAEIEMPASETHGPFVPGLELHRAVAVRIGPDMFDDLSEIVHRELQAKPIAGVLPGTTTQERQAGIVFTAATSPIRYRVPVDEIAIEPTDRGTFAVRVLVSNVVLTIAQTNVRGLLCTATAGPMCVVVGHRQPVPLEIEAAPYLCDGRFRLKTRSVRFSIPQNNWYVTRPRVREASLFLPEERVADSLVEGVYGQRSRIESEVRRTVTAAIDGQAFELPPVSDDQLLTALWPVPAYRPRVRPRMEQLHVDENGLAVVFGMTVAAPEPSTAPATPASIDFEMTQADVGQGDLAVSAAEGLIGPLSAQLIEAGLAHINVLDIPDGRYAHFADREVLTELIPAIRTLPPEAELRTELYLREPIELQQTKVASDADGRHALFVLQVPDMTAVVGSRLSPGDEWQDYAEISYSVSQPVRLQLGASVAGGRQVISACNDSPQITATTRWLADPPAADPTIDEAAAIRLFEQSWTIWSDACKPTAIVIPDLELRGYVRRLDRMEPAARGLSVRFDEPEIAIENGSDAPLVFRTQNADGAWLPETTLPSGETFRVRVSRPLEYESRTGGRWQRFAIPPGRTATFKPSTDGVPGLVLDPLPTPLDMPARVPGTGN